MKQYGQSGRALLIVLLLGLAVATVVATLASSVARTSDELRAWRDVLCARYGARAGAAAGPIADGRPEIVGAQLDSLRVTVRFASGGDCVTHATAVCGGARRAEERAADPALCGAAGLRFRPPP